MDQIELDPEMVPLAAAVADPGAPTFRSLGPAAMRAMLAQLSPKGGPEMASVADVSLAGVPARDYRPLAEPRATVVFFHGGGWVLGSVDDYDHFARTLAAATGARVVSVDYRLAPEHPFPAAVDDAWAALQAVAPLGDLFVAGDSAGGNLAAVTAQLSRDAGRPALAGQILLYPSVAGDVQCAAMHAFAPPVLPREEVAAYYDAYAPDPAMRQNPRFAPARGRLDDLAPALVVTAGADLLAAEGEAYAEALAAAGVAVRRHRAPGAVHSFLTLAPGSRATGATLSVIADFIKTARGGRS